MYTNILHPKIEFQNNYLMKSSSVESAIKDAFLLLSLSLFQQSRSYVITCFKLIILRIHTNSLQSPSAGHLCFSSRSSAASTHKMIKMNSLSHSLTAFFSSCRSYIIVFSYRFPLQFTPYRLWVLVNSQCSGNIHQSIDHIHLKFIQTET